MRVNGKPGTLTRTALGLLEEGGSEQPLTARLCFRRARGPGPATPTLPRPSR